MLDQLRQMDASALDYAVRSGSFRDEFRRAGSKGRRQIVPYLTRERIGELGIEARVALVDSLQYGMTRRYREEGVRDVFLATSGSDLTRLKHLIDRGLDHRDLSQLVYHDIDHADVREEILEHIQRQAVPCAEIKIISDVDDTFYRNWVDPRYPSRTVYPGVKQLYRELDGQEPGDVVFLTGRPGDRTGYLERIFRRRLGGLGAPEASMLTGSFVHQFFHPWVFARKWQNFERYRVLYPEMPFVMLGDSGQADPEFIAQARERFPDHVKAGLVHRVKALEPERLARCQQVGVEFFDTYVGAAIHLHGKGLLTREQVARVADAARTDFARIQFPDETVRAQRLAELETDLADAQASRARVDLA